MKAIRIIALLLTLCMFSAVLLACNSGNEPTGTGEPSGTSAPTEKPTQKPTEKPTEPTYAEGELEYFLELADYNGKPFTESNIDIGQGSFMHVAKDTTPEEYEAYKTSLEEQGFYLYTTNEIGDNQFATYITETQIVYTMLIYYDYDSSDKTYYGGKASTDHYEVRVMEDSRSEFDIVPLEDQNEYEKDASVKPSFTMLSDNEVSWPGRMGYVYQLSDGSFFIIDGGYYHDSLKDRSSATALMELMTKWAPDPENIVIAGWMFTHIHSDHVGAFYDISRNEEYMSKITIEKLIYNMPSSDEMAVQDVYKWGGTDVNTTLSDINGCTDWEENMFDAIDAMRPQAIYKAHAGQVFYIRELTMTIYAAQDLLLYSNIPTAASSDSLFTSCNWHNSTSVITGVDFGGKNTLFLGDTHVYACHYLLNPVYRNVFKESADIVQVAHHGYTDTRADLLYKHLDVEMVLWPVCKQHYDGMDTPDSNDIKNTGRDDNVYYENGKVYGGVYSATGNNFNHQYLNSSVTEHVYFINNYCMTVDDFDSWDFYEWDAVDDAKY